jgi:Helicase associated domain
LGNWVAHQRKFRKKRDAGKPCGGMNADRISLLEDIGFVWGVFDEGWDAMYESLKDYKTKHGHTNVSTLDSDNKVSGLLVIL